MSVDLGKTLASWDHYRDGFKGVALRIAVVQERSGTVQALEPNGLGRSWIRVSHTADFNDALHAVVIRISNLAVGALVCDVGSNYFTVDPTQELTFTIPPEGMAMAHRNEHYFQPPSHCCLDGQRHKSCRRLPEWDLVRRSKTGASDFSGV